MKNAASTYSRPKERCRKTAQKMIVSHVINYLGSVRWGINPVGDKEYYCLPLPTYEDYEYLLNALENNTLDIHTEEFENTVLVAVPNVYMIQKDGQLWEKHRPEDKGKKDIPRIAYMVVKKSDLWDDRKFKCRKDFAKFLNHIRALLFVQFHVDSKMNPEHTSVQVKKAVGKDQRGKSYKDILSIDGGYSKNKIDKISRHNENIQHVKLNRKSKDLSSLYNFFTKEGVFTEESRITFNKNLERLKEIGISVFPT